MFFIIVASIFIMPILLKKFNIPGITSVMLAGILIGPHVLGLVEMNEALNIFSEFGAVFLMFLAGMEVDNDTLRREFKKSTVVGLFSLTIPAIGGYFIGKFFGLNFIGALLYAVIFSSHSVGIVYALMDELNLTKSKFGTTALSATILVDLLSLIILSIIIKMSSNIQNSDILYFIGEVIIYITVLLLTIPYASKFMFKRCSQFHIKRIHFVLFIILISILAGELIGLHPIIGAFITGIAVSEALTKEEHDELLNKNLNAIGYGFFIPIFFLTLGISTDITVLADLHNIWLVLATIVSASLLKIASGYFSFKLIGYDKIKSLCGGLLTIPKISASLVAASVGLEMGIISREFFVAIVVLSLISSMITPIFVKNLVVKYKDDFEIEN
jgi:Kef-type K+ transport system membrane component KefB